MKINFKILFNVKKLSLLITCLFTFGTSQAQTDWKKWYGEPNQQETLIAAEPGADGTHFWAAGTIANHTHDDFWLVRCNPQGEILWSDTFGSPDRNEQLLDFSRNAATGEMWLIGESRPSSAWISKQIFLQKLDANGQLIFEKTGLFGLLENGRLHLNIKTVGDGVLVFHPQTGILRRLNALGEVLWERTFAATDGYFNKQYIAALPDGGCFFTDYLNTSPVRCVLHRLHADGQTIWQTTIETSSNPMQGSESMSVVADLADTSVFVAVRGGFDYSIQKFSPGGQMIWKSNLPFDAYQNDFVGPWLLQIPAKNRIALFSNHAYQVLDDQTGEFVAGEDHYYPFQKPEYIYLNDGVSFADGTFAVVGTTSKNAYGYDGYSAKTSADDFQILQENAFGNPSPNDTDYESRVETATDGGYFLANVAYFEKNKTGIALRKISAGGAEIWKKSFVEPFGYWNFEMQRAPDGNLFLLGHGNDSIDVIKLNPDGGLLWQRNFKCIGDIAVVSTSAPLRNGGIIVFYPFASGQPTMRYYEARAFDANGTEIWRKRIFEDLPSGSYLGMGVSSAEDLGDGTVAAVGHKTGFGSWVARFDLLTGTLIFKKALPVGNNNLKSIFPTADGSFLTLEFKPQGGGLDSLNLFKINGQGEILSIKNLPVPPKDFWYISDFFRAPDGSCVVSAPSDGDFLDVFKLNDNLDLLDQKSVNLQANTDWISGQSMSPDGSFLLCGEGAHQNSGDVFLIKTGKTGIVSSQNLENELGFQASPNPISDDQPLQILLENDFLGAVKIEILSLDGRVLQTFFKEKIAGNLVEILYLDDDYGSFFLRVSDGKTSATRLVLKF